MLINHVNTAQWNKGTALAVFLKDMTDSFRALEDLDNPIHPAQRFNIYRDAVFRGNWQVKKDTWTIVQKVCNKEPFEVKLVSIFETLRETEREELAKETMAAASAAASGKPTSTADEDAIKAKAARKAEKKAAKLSSSNSKPPSNSNLRVVVSGAGSATETLTTLPKSTSPKVSSSLESEAGGPSI